jgi:hypothetical protein
MRIRPTVTAAAPLALALLLAPPLARAAEPTAPAAEASSGGFAPAPAAAGGFGAEGQLALSMGATADQPFFFHKTSGGGWQLHVEPAADYFIVPHVSVGGRVVYDHDSGGGSNAVGLAARAGYDLAIDDRFSFWPLGGLAVTYASGNHTSHTDTWVTAFAPVLFHPAPHFFVGLGPSVNIHLSGPGGTEYGVDSIIGGWF